MEGHCKIRSIDDSSLFDEFWKYSIGNFAKVMASPEVEYNESGPSENHCPPA